MQPYKKLFTYWFSVIIYDYTVEFCKRWITSYKLTEQMTGAGRSGKQNIVEGSDALSISLKTAIKLPGVAKHSLEELIGDYEDFLRQRGMSQWGKDDPQVIYFRARSAKLVRSLSLLSNLRDPLKKQDQEIALLKEYPLPQNPEKAANLMLTLCHQATYLLDRQIKSLEEKHKREGGFTERLYRERKNYIRSKIR